MLENLSEFVGYAMHDDLLMRARQRTRAGAAGRALDARRAKSRRVWRETAARALMVLALRLSPGTVVERLALAK